MIIEFWDTFLYKPLFNLLIFLYQAGDLYNLGFAVVFLTLILKIFLLPFTLASQFNRFRFEKLNQEVFEIKKDFKHDPVRVKEEIRKAAKENKIKPWARTASLFIQGLVLLLLYQVFLGGINNKLDDLYSFVREPDFINIYFFGLNLGERNLFFPVIVAIFLFIEIYFSQRMIKNLLTPSDILYLYLFPVLSAVILFMLPVVKSIFILTSILFTGFISILTHLFVKKR